MRLTFQTSSEALSHIGAFTNGRHLPIPVRVESGTFADARNCARLLTRYTGKAYRAVRDGRAFDIKA